MKTEIFESYNAFKQRTDKAVNGVSTKFANKYPNWKEMNETNQGCWNCVECTECRMCKKCKNCFGVVKRKYVQNLRGEQKTVEEILELTSILSDFLKTMRVNGYFGNSPQPKEILEKVGDNVNKCYDIQAFLSNYSNVYGK